MHISDLPPELHAYIVAFACAEIPSARQFTTAHTLSLVSSYWYSVARPFKYHSLRVTGTRPILSLFTHLETLPERERRVRYLFLSDAPVEATIDEMCLHRQKSAIAQLLVLLVPSLYTLELHLTNPAFATSLFAVLWALSAPRLVSLSVKGYYPFPSAPNAKSHFSRLEHLSLDGLSNPSGLLSLGTLECTFPKLESLEVHGLRGALAFAREVDAAVGERVDQFRSTGLPRKADVTPFLPRTLVSLSLFLAPEPCNKYSKRGQAVHTEMLKILNPLTTRDGLKVKPALQVVVEESVRYKEMSGRLETVTLTSS